MCLLPALSASTRLPGTASKKTAPSFPLPWKTEISQTCLILYSFGNRYWMNKQATNIYILCSCRCAWVQSHISRGHCWFMTCRHWQPLSGSHALTRFSFLCWPSCWNLSAHRTHLAWRRHAWGLLLSCPRCSSTTWLLSYPCPPSLPSGSQFLTSWTSICTWITVIYLWVLPVSIRSQILFWGSLP